MEFKQCKWGNMGILKKGFVLLKGKYLMKNAWSFSSRICFWHWSSNKENNKFRANENNEDSFLTQIETTFAYTEMWKSAHISPSNQC